MLRLTLLLVLAAGTAQAQARTPFENGVYRFLPRTAAFDPQFDAWQTQIAADSFKVLDPSGALFLISVARVSGDTLQWTDVMGPCTGVVSRYLWGRDSLGVKLDLIEDACSERAAAIVHFYFVRRPSQTGAIDRPRLEHARR